MNAKHTLFFVHGMGDSSPTPNFTHLWNAIGVAYDAHRGGEAGIFRARYQHGFVDWHAVTSEAKLSVFHDAFDRMEPQPAAPSALLHPIASMRTFVTFFLGDVVAYVSENDNHIRSTVWELMQPALKSDGEFSIIAHSLGAVIAFDFLFNLFDEQTPQLFCPVDRAHPEVDVRALQRRFRALFTLGSPTGLFMLRKGELWSPVEPNRAGPPFSNIVNPLWPEHTWINFWDREDVLAYPLTQLFARNAAHNAGRPLVDCEVNSGWNPVTSHVSYWTVDAVAERIARSLP